MSTPWWFFLIAAGLIVMSGFFSGLNLGLMSLAPDELKVVMEGSDNDQAKKDAAKIYPLRKRGNLLLCTLLLGNTLVNALIAILLADATDGLIWKNPTGPGPARVFWHVPECVRRRKTAGNPRRCLLIPPRRRFQRKPRQTVDAPPRRRAD